MISCHSFFQIRGYRSVGHQFRNGQRRIEAAAVVGIGTKVQDIVIGYPSGRIAGDLMEDPVEIAYRIKTAQGGDLRHMVFLFPDQIDRFVDTDVIEVLGKGEAGHLLEES